MTQDELTLLMQLIYGWAEQVSDNHALTWILRKSEVTQRPVVNWAANLKALRETEEYHNIHSRLVQQLDQIVQRVHEGQSQQEFQELLRQIPEEWN